jgi:bifunctional DNase/RNase
MNVPRRGSYLRVRANQFSMGHSAEVEGIGTGRAPGGELVPAALLRARGEYLPVFVTDDQADAIRRGLANEPFDRPLTHDLLAEMVTELGGAFDRVRIDDLQDGTFYAKLDAQRYDAGDVESMTFDARPSDAVALAVRTDCPIEIEASVLDAAGRSADELGVSEE